MGIGNDAFGRVRSRQGGPDLFGDFDDLATGFKRASPGYDHRPFGSSEECSGRHDKLGRRCGPRRPRSSLPFAADGHFQDIDRNLDMHRSRARTLEHREGAGHQIRNVVGRTGSCAEPGYGRGERPLLGNFVQMAPSLPKMRYSVGARDQQQWNRIGVGSTQGRRRVGDAWAGDYNAYARFA